MTDNKNMDAKHVTRRIAIQRAARADVDSQGKRTGEPSVYEYDIDGILVRATKGDAQ